MNPHFIDNQWQAGSQEPLISLNPATGDTLWQGNCASASVVQQAVDAAHHACKAWQALSFEQRLAYLQRFVDIVENRKDNMAKVISQETGKALWDAKKEAASVCAKLGITVDAYHQRTPDRHEGATRISHQGHGVMAVLGPYNFPCHLPNGHILPALLAGNTVVFKPSEQTPACGEFLIRCMAEAGLPKGVVNLVQGGRATGEALISATGISGVLFTGSESGGIAIHKQLAGRPEILLAMEMGGNNPLVVSEKTDVKAAAECVIESAFISSGQRCTCARRVLVPATPWGDAFIDQLAQLTRELDIGRPDAEAQPFIAAMISDAAARRLLGQQAEMERLGARSIVPAALLELGPAFVQPGIIDVTPLQETWDEEVFGPLLQVIRYNTLDEAIYIANDTRFGLSAGLLSHDETEFTYFRQNIRAGIVNWNAPLTGASSAMPFGGCGRSGNHRPSAYYAADYCAFPVATLQRTEIGAPTVPLSARK